MPVIALIIGIAILITAYNDTAGDLGNALKQDLPGFFPWLMAIGVILGLGYVPGLEKPSRYLLVLVGVVLLLTKGKGIFEGFQKFALASSSSTGQGQPPAEPTTAYAGGEGTPTQSEISGTTGPTTGQAAIPLTLQPQNYGPGAIASTSAASPQAVAPQPHDPAFAAVAAIDPALAGLSASIGFGGLT
jgi:hypothetical protein